MEVKKGHYLYFWREKNKVISHLYRKLMTFKFIKQKEGWQENGQFHNQCNSGTVCTSNRWDCNSIIMQDGNTYRYLLYRQ